MHSQLQVQLILYGEVVFSGITGSECRQTLQTILTVRLKYSEVLSSPALQLFVKGGHLRLLPEAVGHSLQLLLTADAELIELANEQTRYS